MLSFNPLKAIVLVAVVVIVVGSIKLPPNFKVLPTFVSPFKANVVIETQLPSL